MENKTAGILISRPCVECFRADIDSEGERHSGRDVFSVLWISIGQIKGKGRKRR